MTQKLTYLSTEGEIICFSRAFTGNWSEWQIDGSNAEKEIDYSQITAVGSENGSIMITNETGSFDLTKMDDYLDNYIEDTSNVEIEARFKRYLDGVFKSYILDIVYPVGSIYISANSTSPAVLFGGKWRQIQDKFLLAGYTTYLPTTTGGSATASIKAHKHGANVGANRDLSKIVVYNQNGLYDGEAAAGFSLSVSATKGTSKVSTDKLMFTTEAGSATINTIPPYYSVYVWQREED